MQTHLLLRFAPLSAVTFAALSAACVAPPAEETESSEDALVGAVPARAKRYAPIGVIQGIRPSDQRLVNLCTGTLIGPHTVLAAAHCVQAVKGVDNFRSGTILFSLGYDSAHPERTIRVVSGKVAPLTDGGATNRGSDVGVLQLATDIDDVEPLVASATALGAADLGKRLPTVGYGMQKHSHTLFDLLTRRAGAMTINALEGHPFHSVFESSDELADYLIAKEGVPEAARPAITSVYGPYFNDPAKHLITGYEVYVGLGPNDAQTCRMDSGGPLLRLNEGKLEVVGVASRSFAVIDNASHTNIPCTLGSVYALVAPTDVQGMITAALADTCRGVPEAGHCSGKTAMRCTSDGEGPKRVTLMECGDLGLGCGVDEDGAVGCVDLP
jgi:V8-like Glu-specific endopeptidase